MPIIRLLSNQKRYLRVKPAHQTRKTQMCLEELQKLFRDLKGENKFLEKIEFLSGPRISFSTQHSLLWWNLVKFEQLDLEKITSQVGISVLVESVVLEEVYWNITAL